MGWKEHEKLKKHGKSTGNRGSARKYNTQSKHNSIYLNGQK